MQRPAGTLADLRLRALLAQLADSTPAPAGGSAIAVACSIAAALVEMAAMFTLARPELADRHARMREVQTRAAQLRDEALALAEVELNAYTPVLEALRLGAEDPTRQARLDEARSRAADPPLALARVASELAGLAAEAVRTGNRNLAGDAITGALLAEAACRAAACLVELNLAGLPPDADRTGSPDDASLAGFRDEADGEASRQDTRGTAIGDLVRRAWQSRLKALEENADTRRTEQ